MMMAEGVSRVLDPSLNIWGLAEPLIADWVAANRGPQARLRDGLETLERTLARLPRIAENLDSLTEALARGQTPIGSGSGRGGRGWFGRAAFLVSLLALGIALAALLD